ncbi:hypothetical protein QN360_21580, partial [Glaciimonas sp. CA11.2]|uniref:hypothetical protein n=1 Tax=Glaciimonas sp. CA11.2 TaxID=3048601 RepID=UPI002B238438
TPLSAAGRQDDNPACNSHSGKPYQHYPSNQHAKMRIDKRAHNQGTLTVIKFEGEESLICDAINSMIELKATKNILPKGIIAR